MLLKHARSESGAPWLAMLSLHPLDFGSRFLIIIKGPAACKRKPPGPNPRRRSTLCQRHNATWRSKGRSFRLRHVGGGGGVHELPIFEVSCCSHGADGAHDVPCAHVCSLATRLRGRRLRFLWPYILASAKSFSSSSSILVGFFRGRVGRQVSISVTRMSRKPAELRGVLCQIPREDCHAAVAAVSGPAPARRAVGGGLFQVRAHLCRCVP